MSEYVTYHCSIIFEIFCECCLTVTSDHSTRENIVTALIMCIKIPASLGGVYVCTVVSKE